MKVLAQVCSINLIWRTFSSGAVEKRELACVHKSYPSRKQSEVQLAPTISVSLSPSWTSSSKWLHFRDKNWMRFAIDFSWANFFLLLAPIRLRPMSKRRHANDDLQSSFRVDIKPFTRLSWNELRCLDKTFSFRCVVVTGKANSLLPSLITRRLPLISSTVDQLTNKSMSRCFEYSSLPRAAFLLSSRVDFP